MKIPFASKLTDQFTEPVRQTASVAIVALVVACIALFVAVKVK